MTVAEFADSRGVSPKTIYSRASALVLKGKLPPAWRDENGNILDESFSILDQLYPIQDGTQTEKDRLVSECVRLTKQLQTANDRIILLEQQLKTAQLEKAATESKEKAATKERETIAGKIGAMQSVAAVQAARIADLQGELDRVHDTLDKAVVAMLPGNRPSLFERLFKRREK